MLYENGVEKELILAMKTNVIHSSLSVALLALCCCQAKAQIYDTNGDYVQTFAGSGFTGYVDGVGQQTMFNYPSKVAADSFGNLFVMDGGNSRIRKITPDGTVTTFAGGGTGNLPGYGTSVSLANYIIPTDGGSMIVDRSNTLLLTRTVNDAALLRIRSDGYVTATSLPDFSQQSGLCVDSGNNIYYSSYVNKIYRYKTNGVIEVFAGSGNWGAVDGNGIFTSFSTPTALAADGADNIYVYDSGNYLIRRINQNRDVVTIAGNNLEDLDGVGRNASFYSISAMCTDESGNVILACGLSIRKMSPTTNIITLAGNFSQHGYANGAGNVARFNGASGVCVSGGTVYFADYNNQRIRSITNNATAQPVLPANLQLNTYSVLTITGTVGRTYQVQSSPDMTNWTTRATLLLNSSPYLWIDQNPVSGSKFYRALLLP
jgi:sugar lactone lactonase YvrE